MLNGLKSFALGFLFFYFLGCASSQVREKESSRLIIQNQTTQTEILEVLGMPSTVTIDRHLAASEIWTYFNFNKDMNDGSSLIFIGGSDYLSSSIPPTSAQDLVVIFGQDKVVSDYYLALSPSR